MKLDNLSLRELLDLRRAYHKPEFHPAKDPVVEAFIQELYIKLETKLKTRQQA